LGSLVVLGVILGGIAVLNILFRSLSREQEMFLLLVGAANWILGGVICYAIEGIKIVRHQEEPHHPVPKPAESREWHAASDFVLPGNRKSILPPRY
jgi:hypothetical protein